MTARCRWLWLLPLCLGCHGPLALEVAGGSKPKPSAPAAPSREPSSPSPPPGAAAPPLSHVLSARKLWEQGLAALRQGRPEEAVACYQQSLAADPRFDRVHLSLAAAYLEMDDPKAACAHLGLYLQGRPDHLLVRAQYAELLHRLERPAEARVQFERFVADSQDCGDLHNRYLIHCHTRLMEIAEDEASDYDEYLHRGIGLWLLARQRLTLPDPEGQLSVQGLLCKAAGELTQARQERPDEARPCWYLYQVWTQLGQRQPALRWLRQAESAAPFSYLTPAEKGRLYLACRDLEEGSWK